MDWFEKLFGFQEDDYDLTQQRLEVVGSTLRSRVNGRSFRIGELELVSLQKLRERVKSSGGLAGRLSTRIVRGDVRQMHQDPQYAGALFQVASQFNLLEMVGPSVTPEQGVTRYQGDPTQGPACAIAAGAATVYRNYFVPMGGAVGQRHDRQLDGLADTGMALGVALGVPPQSLWEMRNGYALCNRDGLDRINGLLTKLDDKAIDDLREKLRIGVHRDVEVTDTDLEPGPIVSQAFCSALPVRYSDVPHVHWKSFASLILEAAYEATICVGVENAMRGQSNIVLLTRLGGGAFGNDDDWIHQAMRRALHKAQGFELDVRLVSYGPPSEAVVGLASEFSA